MTTQTASFDSLIADVIAGHNPVVPFGKVTGVSGMVVEAVGLGPKAGIGGLCHLVSDNQQTRIPCEVVGFRDDKTLLMPFGAQDGLCVGARVEVTGEQLALRPTMAWLGRMIDPLGQPLDSLGPLPQGQSPAPLKAPPPHANSRKRLGAKMNLGVKAMNAFTTLCEGQRMGIFAGSGVGKSILMSMLARNTKADIVVIGLVGERGREVKEFIEDDLGPEGLKRAVVIVATSDQPPLLRRLAGYTTLAVAEFFRNQGLNVLCLMDSVTRFAMAHREIGLSAGEPPTTKGYPPTTFNELARLLERAGQGAEDQGSITALFTVLVEGDDQNEPISDTVRGILDGHIVLDRDIAHRGRYPAINILRSVSRSMPRCNTDAENALLRRARQLIASYEDMAELIRLGAYKRGSNPEVDEAIKYYGMIETFLTQTPYESLDLDASYAALAAAVGVAWPPAAEV